jgi:hypothetical protein
LKNLAYANVYSKQGTATISLDAAKEVVISVSSGPMTGEGVPQEAVKESNSSYYAAATQTADSKSYEQIKIDSFPKEHIQLTGMKCRSWRAS